MFLLVKRNQVSGAHVSLSEPQSGLVQRHAHRVSLLKGIARVPRNPVNTRQCNVSPNFSPTNKDFCDRISLLRICFPACVRHQYFLMLEIETVLVVGEIPL